MRKRFVVSLIVTAVGIATATGLVLQTPPEPPAVSTVDTHIDTPGFDAELWRAQSRSGASDNPRAGLVVALESGFLKAGLPRADVRMVLGEPERVSANADMYELGVAPYGIDEEVYVIVYDGGDRVASFLLRRR